MREIDYRAIEIFVGKIKDKKQVGEMPMTLESNNSPQIYVSASAVSVLFMKVWYCEIHVGCAFNALELRFCLFTSVWEIIRL